MMMKNIRAETGTGIPCMRKNGRGSSDVMRIIRQMSGRARLHGAEDLHNPVNEDNGHKGRRGSREEQDPLFRRMYPWA
jgi:hypothetical protein